MTKQNLEVVQANKKRKYNLPKYVCWDVRNTVLANRVWFGANLRINGKTTNTAAKTVKMAMQYVVENRLKEKIWDIDQARAYLATYEPNMENGYSVELAKTISKTVGPRKPKRMYDLPKYVCYDKAESRNRERNVFQTSLRINGKVLKNNLYTVKEATVDVAKKMLDHPELFSLKEVGEYLQTYKESMENGNFVPSDTPKSPCLRKKEIKKQIKKLAKEAGISVKF